MLRSIGASVTRPSSTFLDRMWRRSRYVQVDVVDWGRVADSFQMSDPNNLAAAARAVYWHLPQEGVTIRLLGIEEQSLPLGILRTTRQIALCDLSEARSFLDG